MMSRFVRGVSNAATNRRDQARITVAERPATIALARRPDPTQIATCGDNERVSTESGRTGWATSTRFSFAEITRASRYRARLEHLI